jgi:hypothetical protein
MTEIRKPKQYLVLKGFGHCILEFGAWNLYIEPQNSKAEAFTLNQVHRTRFLM